MACRAAFTSVISSATVRLLAVGKPLAQFGLLFRAAGQLSAAKSDAIRVSSLRLSIAILTSSGLIFQLTASKRTSFIAGVATEVLNGLLLT